MGWADCGTDNRGRNIGYGFEGACDHKGCRQRVSRGLGSACGGMHGTGTLGGDSRIDWDSMGVACEGYFCDKHLAHADLEHEDGTDLYTPQLCLSCVSRLERAYRDDEDWRDHWPTSALPTPLAQGMSAGTAKTRNAVEGEARQPGGEAMRPNDIAQNQGPTV
jgi:hypothetical protein